MRVYTGLHSPLTINGLDNVAPNGDNDYSVIKYEYDFYGNKTSYTDAIGNEQVFNYNQFNGRLLSKEQHYIDGNSEYQQDYKISYTYDSSGNVTQIQGVKGTETLTKTFTYDMTGKVITASDENTTMHYVYDKLGNCTNISYDLNNKHYEIQYDYPVDKLTEVRTYIDGVRQSRKAFLFNTKKQLCNAVYYDINNTVISHEGMSYDTNGNIAARLSSGGRNLIMQYQYNYMNLQTYLYIGATGYEQDCAYSVDGNLTSKIEKSSDTTTATTNYTYDDLNRLNSEAYIVPNGANWSKNYSFDDYNNISTTAYTDNNAANHVNDYTTTYSYDKANKITEQKGVKYNNSVYFDNKFNYDNAGNLASKVDGNNNNAVLQSFTYDSMNRTKSITTGSVETSFKYNANDQRLTKTVGSKTVTSVYEGSDIAMDVTVDGGTTSQSIYFKGLEQFGVMVDGVKYSFGMDVKNDITQAISNQGTKTFSYDAYGTLFAHSGNDVPVSSFGYRGYYTDSETGLCYLNARYYDPSTERFTQEDTYQQDNLQMNLYGYCSANPVGYTDPTGHDIIWLNSLDGLGHTSLIIQYYASGKTRWYYTFFGDTAIQSREVPDVAMQSITNLNYWLHTTSKPILGGPNYYDSTYVAGDFTQSYIYFLNNYYSPYINQHKNPYQLTTNNCTTMSWNAICKGNIKDGTSAVSFMNTISGYYSKYLDYYENESYIPNLNRTTISDLFQNKAFTKSNYTTQINNNIAYYKNHVNDKSYFDTDSWATIDHGAFSRGMVKSLPRLI